jgi:hypothetical protein
MGDRIGTGAALLPLRRQVRRKRQLFVAAIYPDYGSDMKSFAKIGEQLMRTVPVPAVPRKRHWAA